MKKLIAVLLVVSMLVPTLCFARELGIIVDKKTFPDVNFRNWVKWVICGESDHLSYKTRMSITELELDECIVNLKGIEYFPNLKKLVVRNNRLKKMDLTKNHKLEYLDCQQNQLTKLDLSGNPRLTYVDCSENKIKTINLTKCKKLTTLNCSRNRLTSLDLSGNPKLTFLDCNENRLKSLDLKKNKKLTYLSCDFNRLTKLDVRKNTKLDFLNCQGNQLYRLDMLKSQHPGTVYLSVNYYPVTSQGNRVDLTKIPDFDYKKAEIMSGGTLENGILTVSDEIYYQGQCVLYSTQVLRRFNQEYFGLRVKVKPAALKTLTLEADHLPYTGEAVEPEVTVQAKMLGQMVTLVKDQDYTVTYLDNTDRGTARVKVTAMGWFFKGSLETTFQIE